MFPTAAVLTTTGVALFGLAAVIGVRHLARRAAVRPVAPLPAAIGAADCLSARSAESGGASASAPRGEAGPAPRAGAAASTAAGRDASPRLRPTPSAPSPPIVAIFYCRRGAEFNVSPEDAVVTVDGKAIGKADD